jgi:TonB family protein
MRWFIGLVPLFAIAQSGTPRFDAAAVVHKVEPVYTSAARAAGLQGTVSLYVEVRRDGKPADVQVMQGLGLGLDEAAVNAVKQWQFTSTSGSIEEIEDELDVEVSFHLDTESPGRPWFVESETYEFPIPDRERPGDIERPVPTSYVAPDADACREAGPAEVRLIVGKDGVPREIKPVGSGPMDAALKAVESWRFQPAKAYGQAVEAYANVVFACRPGGEAAQPPQESGPPFPPARATSPPVLLSKTESACGEDAGDGPRPESHGGREALAVQTGNESR